MQQIFVLLSYVFIFGCYVRADLLYNCNFDNATLDDHCFTTPILVLSGLAILSELPPDSPLSDVTSSLKPTNNGEVCKLPYKVPPYTWDMYFCYKGFCPTATNTNSTCASGQFGGLQLSDNKKQSFQLKTESGGINGINQQYLTYYYYMSTFGEKSIEIRKEEVDGGNEIIDVVRSSPFNGWIKHQVKFNAMMRGYKLYFDVQKTSSEMSLFDIGFDEISISEEDETTSESPITTMISTLIDTTASESISTIQTTQIITTIVESTTTIPFETSTISPTDSAQQSTTTTGEIQPPTTVDSTYSETSPTTIHLSTYITNLPTISSETTTETNSVPTNVTTLMNESGVNPSNKTYIIILSTVIPIVVIAIIGIFIKIRRPSSIRSYRKKRRQSAHESYSDSSTDGFELQLSNDDYWF